MPTSRCHPTARADPPYRGQHQSVGAGSVRWDEERGWQQLDGGCAEQHSGGQEICQGEEEKGAKLGDGTQR